MSILSNRVARYFTHPTVLLVGAAALVLVQVAVLYGFGQPLIAASGRILLWVGNPLSPDTSQQLADWYSFSHIIHGMLFFWLLRYLLPGAPIGARALLAMGLEISWEVLENTPMVIEAYRSQALARGYTGDSILNSVSDTFMMLLGFLLAWRFKAKYMIALALSFELFTAYKIRDNLTLNILNFALPLDSVHEWQSGK